MPIGAIIDQPAANSIRAAYRPITFLISATRTNGAPIPPVVYCDIYFFGIYYKTISKSQYTKLNPGVDSEWLFDIQDACQEYHQKFLADNGVGLVSEAPLISISVYVKFRSSGFDADGFITTEGVAPIQATDSTGAIAGTGIQSNVFYSVNATLQHEDNQDLSAHLNSFKKRTWDATTWPLTHRPDRYKVCESDSDSFPIISDKIPTSIRLYYMLKDTSNYVTADSALPCLPGALAGAYSLPNAEAGAAYSYTITLLGTSPFALANVVKPAWMDITVIGNEISFSGVPLEADIAVDVPVSFDVTNCAAANSFNFADTIDIVASSVCDPIALVNAINMPDATTTEVYNYVIDIDGDAPFVLTVTSKPSWMTVNVVGNTVVLGGTPANTDRSENAVIDLTVKNCSGENSIRIFDTIKVIAAGHRIAVVNATVLPPRSVTLSTIDGSFTLPFGGSDMTISDQMVTIASLSGDADFEWKDIDGNLIIGFPSRSQGNVMDLGVGFPNIVQLVITE